MKRLLVTFAVMCLAVYAYAQKDVPAGGSMEVASVESDDSIGGVGQGKQITMYKVKDNDGNPSFLLCVSHTMRSLTFGTEDSNTTFSIPGGAIALDFGTTYQEAMDQLNTLLALFSEKDGTQMELSGHDGSTVPCTLYKGFLGKHLDIAETSITKSDIKSLIFSFKISKKLHPDL